MPATGARPWSCSGRRSPKRGNAVTTANARIRNIGSDINPDPTDARSTVNRNRRDKGRRPADALDPGSFPAPPSTDAVPVRKTANPLQTAAAILATIANQTGATIAPEKFATLPASGVTDPKDRSGRCRTPGKRKG